MTHGKYRVESQKSVPFPLITIFLFSITHQQHLPSSLISAPLLWLFCIGQPRLLPSRLHWWVMGQESPCSAGDVGLILGLGRSPGGGHGSPLQYSCLGNPMDRKAWWTTVHVVTKNQTPLSNENNNYMLCTMSDKTRIQR